MPKLYAPLQIAENMEKHRKEAMEKSAMVGLGLKGTKSVLGLASNFSGTSFNLDEFLSWVIGPSFCKRSYQGDYTEINNRLLNIIERDRSQGGTYKKSRKRLQNCIAFDTLFECWKTYKQAYRFDKDFVDELLATNKVEIPTEALKRLPVRCFYLDLEKCTQFHPVIGFFVYAGFDEKGRINLVFSRVRPNKEDDYEFDSIYISSNDMEKESLMGMGTNGEPSLQFYYDLDAIGRLAKKESVDESMFRILFFALQAMLYLSSNKPDIQKVGDPVKQCQKPGKKPGKCQTGDNTQGPVIEDQTGDNTQGPVIEDVGVRYGRAIRKAKTHASGMPPNNGAGMGKAPSRRKPMVSHIRAAHWHHYWTGRGRTELTVKWIPPTFVTGQGKELPVTIHNVSNEERND